MITLNVFVGLLGLLLIYANSLNADNKTEGNKVMGANVILLTYHRSGSSFVGEGVASHEKFAFYFEPLFYPSQVERNNTGAAFKDCLQRLLTCDTDTLDQLRKQNVWILRKYGRVWNTFKNETKYSAHNLSDICKRTPFHLAKTIRLRLKLAVDLVNRRSVPNLKILHLVRDPRARFNSAHTPGGRWSDKEKSVELMCSDMAKDARMVSALPKKDYRLLRYEDMVENPTKTIRDVYKDLLGGLNISPAVQRYIRRHTKFDEGMSASKKATGYYSTFRNSNFDRDHWKHSLNATQIAMIQDKCKEVLLAYGYKFIEVQEL